MVWVMDDWRCKTGRRVSKKSRGGDWRWEVSTGMLMLRRNPCLFTGCTRHDTRPKGKVKTQVRTKIMLRAVIWQREEHLNKSGMLVQWHLSCGNVQSEPRRFLPLQAAGALPPWFSHVLCPSPGLPATERERENEKTMLLQCVSKNYKSHVILGNSRPNTWSKSNAIFAAANTMIPMICAADLLHKRVLRPLSWVKHGRSHISVH